MEYETIGESNTKISKICLGCMSFGSKFDWMIGLEEARPIIERALDLGITFFTISAAVSAFAFLILSLIFWNYLKIKDEKIVSNKINSIIPFSFESVNNS